MKNDPSTPPEAPDARWRATFADAEAQTLDASLAVTPSERLAWLEEALAFAMKAGALNKKQD